MNRAVEAAPETRKARKAAHPPAKRPRRVTSADRKGGVSGAGAGDGEGRGSVMDCDYSIKFEAAIYQVDGRMSNFKLILHWTILNVAVSLKIG
jgi:hypothetical protein